MSSMTVPHHTQYIREIKFELNANRNKIILKIKMCYWNHKIEEQQVNNEISIEFAIFFDTIL